ncbi:MAG: hypothetical protein NVSMB29_06940 [Candidatus Dormibacteria bacterium]
MERGDPPTPRPVAAAPMTPPESTKPALWVAIGLMGGILAGLLLGYVVFRSRGSAPATAQATPSPTVTATPIGTPTASPSPSATPSNSPTSAPSTAAPATSAPASSKAPASSVPGQLTDASFSGCPAMAPGQHPLAPVSGPSGSGTVNPANDFYGCGNAVTPGGTPGFTGNNWELAYSFSCPNSDAPGAAAVPGMNIESVVYAGGGTPIRNDANTQTAYLVFTDNAHAGVPQGGDYRLRTVLVNNATGDNRCRWHIRAYTTPP